MRFEDEAEGKIWEWALNLENRERYGNKSFTFIER